MKFVTPFSLSVLVKPIIPSEYCCIKYIITLDKERTQKWRMENLSLTLFREILFYTPNSKCLVWANLVYVVVFKDSSK